MCVCVCVCGRKGKGHESSTLPPLPHTDLLEGVQTSLLAETCNVLQNHFPYLLLEKNMQHQNIKNFVAHSDKNFKQWSKIYIYAQKITTIVYPLKVWKEKKKKKMREGEF